VEIPLKVSTYDRASGLLIALLVLIGGSVAVLFLAWLMNTIVFSRPARPIKLIENAAGRGDHAEGFARDLEPPGEAELPELQEPQLQTSIQAVTEAVTTVAASMDVFDSLAPVSNIGSQLGDSRPAGPLGEGDDIIPRFERWEIRWESNSLNAYAQQLDFFKIELGAIGGGRKEVDYAKSLTKSRPDARSGPSKAEERLYMTWKGGTLREFDQQLLGRAGIATTGRTLMQFYPQETEDTLAWIEMENAKKQGHSSAKEFLRTVFGVRPQGRGYEFYVIDQLFRPAA
jgi:hypothetical protein